MIRGIPIRLHGPLQAWGGPSYGDDRSTLSFPTRSGVLGLVACCLGIPKTDVASLLELAEGIRVHVRVDARGTLMTDDQTIQGCPRASTTRQTIQSKRQYLQNASFVAVVVPASETTSSPRSWWVTCERIAEALRRPAFIPFLGRRACPATSPFFIAEAVSGRDVLDLFTSIPRAPAELVDVEGPIDFYLDGPDLRALRTLTVRDVPLANEGLVPRLFAERVVSHVRL